MYIISSIRIMDRTIDVNLTKAFSDLADYAPYSLLQFDKSELCIQNDYRVFFDNYQNLFHGFHVFFNVYDSFGDSFLLHHFTISEVNHD